jgi:CHAT domain-containing protein
MARLRIASIRIVIILATASTFSSLNFAVLKLRDKALAQTPNQHSEGYRLQLQGFRANKYHQQQIYLSQDQGNSESDSLSLRGLGDKYYCQGDWKNAITNYQKSIAVAQDNGYSLEIGLSQSELGNVLLQVGNFTEAEVVLRQGIQALEEQRESDLATRESTTGSELLDFNAFETQTAAYRYLQQALIAQNKTEAALEIAEQGRAQVLANLLAKQQSYGIRNPLPIIAPNLAKIRQTAQIEKATIVQYSLISEEFSKRCKRQFWATEIFIWVVQPTGEIAFRRVDLKPNNQSSETSLAGLIDQSLKSFGVGDRGLTVTERNDDSQLRVNPQLQRLYQLLIDPIANLLAQNPNSRIIFVPQSFLFYLPFAALQDSSGKYLIEKHTILTSPSIRVLELTHQKQQLQNIGQGVLIVGNPTPMPQNLPALPGSEQEAKAIAQVLHTQAIIGNQATKAKILPQLSQVRLIHLATHGLLDDTFGLRSTIALAIGDQEKPVHVIISNTSESYYSDDGLLTADDIFYLKLKAELVVLSACETGLGRINGDGIIGLSSAFFAAGVPSVIVSLWSIPDAPTASLMTEFYRNLQQKQNKAEALRNAMLTTIKKHPNPRNWAAFTLIGEAE